jgi:TusA-related sulfurtransferase
MNEVGARIWGLLDCRGAVSDIVSIISREYELEQTQAETEVVNFLAQLESIGAISPL